MFENLGHFFKKIVKEPQKELGSKDAAKERLHLVLMQDRANVSADFLELMKQEIIDVIKKYIVVDEDSIDVRLTNQTKEDGTNGAPSLYANIPIVNIKNDMMAEKIKDFEGVDFNKEMGIPTYSEDNVEEKTEELHEEETPEVIELPANNEKTGTLPENNEEKLQSENDAKEINEQEIAEEMFEEIDDAEDDDDVTFDDLLKAAEAAEKMAEEQLDEEKESDKDESKEEQIENNEDEVELTDKEKEESNNENSETNKDDVKEDNKNKSSKKNNNGKRKKK